MSRYGLLDFENLTCVFVVADKVYFTTSFVVKFMSAFRKNGIKKRLLACSLGSRQVVESCSAAHLVDGIDSFCRNRPAFTDR